MLIQSEAALGRVAIAYPAVAGVAITQRFTHTLTAAQNAAANILELAPIPVGLRVVDIVLDSDKLDTGGAPAITMDVGIMSGEWGQKDDARTVGAEFFAASNVAQAGGLARPTLVSAQRQGPSDKERSIGIKINAAAATPAAGTIGATVTYATW